MITAAGRSMRVFGALLVALLMLGASVARAADELPTAPGVYIKMKSGELIELKAAKPFQYTTNKPEPALKIKGGAKALPIGDPLQKQYLVGKADIKANLPGIQGFYIKGDFDLSALSITRFSPAVLTGDVTVNEGSDTGPGAKKLGSYFDSRIGWIIPDLLQPVEKEPKLYWVGLADSTGLTIVDIGFLAVTMGKDQCFPFVGYNDYERFKAWVESSFEPIFARPLKFVFTPINDFWNRFYKPYAMICALSLFLGAMLWVNLILKKDYVNKGRPFVAWYTDLRLWTVISMMPHVLVYFYFNR